MMHNCINCKFKDRDSRQEPCNTCLSTIGGTYFKPKTKQKLSVEHGDRVDVYMDLAKSYCEHDLKVNVNEMYPKLTQLAYQSYYGSHGQYGPKTAIKKVIFNDPATIVLWNDGTKTVVKAVDEEFDPEKGLAMAITKKALGNKGNYFNEIKKWTEPYYEEQAKKEPEFNLFEFLTNPNGSFSITFTSDDKEITLNDVVMSKKGAE